MVAHHVCCRGAAAVRIKGALTASFPAFGLGDEAVHLTAIDIGAGVILSVRAAEVFIGGIVVRVDALPGSGIIDAHCKLAVLDRETICARVSAKIRVERPVFLHDHDDVLDLGARLGEQVAGHRRTGG